MARGHQSQERGKAPGASPVSPFPAPRRLECPRPPRPRVRSPPSRPGGAKEASRPPPASSGALPPCQAGLPAGWAEPFAEMSVAAIAPRTDSPGTDIFTTRHGSFIIRSDLGCFLQALDFCSGEALKVWDLHPACRGWDHYVGDPTSSAIYLLRGDSFCKVLDLNSEPPSSTFPLHPSCQGGGHYASCEGRFLIFFLERGVVLSVADLATGAMATEVCLEATLLDGLYYYGADAHHVACWRMDEENSLRGHLFTPAAEHAGSFSVHPDVVAFLPGGLSVIHGPAFGAWECLKLISNATDLPMPSTHEITRQVGCSKLTFSQKYDVSGSVDPESLAVSLLQRQFCLPVAYGGLGLQTEQEEWESVAEEGEPLRVILQPRQKLYWWHYRLGLGKEPLLFCRSLKVTRSPSPPTHVPLPLAEP